MSNMSVLTLYWSRLLMSVSSWGKLVTTVTWSRHTRPAHSIGFMSLAAVRETIRSKLFRVTKVYRL